MYENHLSRFLQPKLPGIEVVQQFGIGRSKLDVVLANRIGLELKLNLTQTSECQRLLGQMTMLKDWDGQIIILLLGNTDPQLCKKIREHAEELDYRFFGRPYHHFTVLERPVSAS